MTSNEMALMANIAVDMQKNEVNEVLDKIKRDVFNACSDNYHMSVNKLDCNEIFDIIDKYKSESEE